MTPPKRQRKEKKKEWKYIKIPDWIFWAKNKGKKIKMVEILEQWEKGYSSPDYYCKKDLRKKWTSENLILLRCHTSGKKPYIKFCNEANL